MWVSNKSSAFILLYIAYVHYIDMIERKIADPEPLINTDYQCWFPVISYDTGGITESGPLISY